MRAGALGSRPPAQGGARAPARRDLKAIGPASTSIAPPASSSKFEVLRPLETTPSSLAGRHRNGSRCSKLVAEAASEERPEQARASKARSAGSCPHYLDADGVAKLASLALQDAACLWVFDWGALQTIDAEAQRAALELFRSWIPQDLDMRWLSGGSPVHGDPGGGANRRARRRPGVLAAAPSTHCAADQPA